VRLFIFFLISIYYILGLTTDKMESEDDISTMTGVSIMSGVRIMSGGSDELLDDHDPELDDLR